MTTKDKRNHLNSNQVNFGYIYSFYSPLLTFTSNPNISLGFLGSLYFKNLKECYWKTFHLEVGL